MLETERAITHMPINGGASSEIQPIEPTDLSGKAAALFLKASEKCPASSNAQGGFIALELYETEDSPRQLRDALLADETLMEGISKTANAKHKDGQREVTTEDVRFYSAQAFDIATNYRIARLSRVTLSQIVEEIYPRRLGEVRANPNVGFLNELIQIDVERLLQARSPRRLT